MVDVPDLPDSTKLVDLDRCRTLIDGMLVNIKDAPETDGPDWNKQEAVRAFQTVKDWFEEFATRVTQE